MFILISIILLIFGFSVLIFIKALNNVNNKEMSINNEFHELNDPGNFVNPFNDFNN